MKTTYIRTNDCWLSGEFIACVQNHFVFETCVSRCKIRISPDGGCHCWDTGHDTYNRLVRVCRECLKIEEGCWYIEKQRKTNIYIYMYIFLFICIYSKFSHHVGFLKALCLKKIVKRSMLHSQPNLESFSRLSKALLVVVHNVKWQAAIGVVSTRQIVIWPP